LLLLQTQIAVVAVAAVPAAVAAPPTLEHHFPADAPVVLCVHSNPAWLQASAQHCARPPLAGTGVFLPHLQQENKGGGGGGGAGSGVQPPAAVAESLTGSGPPSFASPLNSNVSGSAWSHALSSDPSVFVEDP